MITSVVFTAEGAALDLERTWVKTMREAYGDVVGKYLEPEDITALIPEGPRHILKKRIGMPKGRTAFDAFIRRWEAGIRPTALCVPGFAVALGAIREAGLSTAVVSRLNRRSLGAALSACGLTDTVDVVLAEEDLPDYPPDASPILAAVSRLAGRVEETLVVSGDARWCQSAHRAGTRVVPAGWTTLRQGPGIHSVEAFLRELQDGS